MDDWQRLVRSHTLKYESAAAEFQRAAGPEASEVHGAPRNFTLCFDPIFLTDVSKSATVPDAALMDGREDDP